MRWTAIGVAALLSMAVRGDVFALNSAEAASSAYRYDLIEWHLSNFTTKWVHWLGRAVPGRGIEDADRLLLVDEYFRLGCELAGVVGDIESVSSTIPADRQRLAALERRLEQIRTQRLAIRDDVEEAIESHISSAARAQRLGGGGELLFPPVDVRLVGPPKVLVTSPRDRILRLDDALLDPDMTIGNREEVEARLMEGEDLSALVLDLGGVATYPASVHNTGDLRGTLQTAAHEWVHHRLFFKPLGRNLRRSPEMLTLNETVADLAGRELGDIALDSIRARTPLIRPAGLGPRMEFVDTDVAPAEDFDFSSEMRETRLTVDQLLADGEVEEAEAYMEARRRLFAANGHSIRKLNQAYFAFNGTYAESDASTSPIGGQVRRLRDLSSDIGAFLSLVSRVSSYDELLALLRDTERGANPV